MIWLVGIVQRTRHLVSPGRERQRGAAAVEAALIAPVLIIVLLFVVGLGRMGQTRQQVESAASDAARAASLERNTAYSATAANAAAEAALDDSGVVCTGVEVDVDVSDYQPGGQGVVTVSCTAQLSDVALTGLPGTKVYSATSTVPIETYRGS